MNYIQIERQYDSSDINNVKDMSKRIAVHIRALSAFLCVLIGIYFGISALPLIYKVIYASSSFIITILISSAIIHLLQSLDGILVAKLENNQLLKDKLKTDQES